MKRTARAVALVAALGMLGGLAFRDRARPERTERQ
jgi:hypothetical protein